MCAISSRTFTSTTYFSRSGLSTSFDDLNEKGGIHAATSRSWRNLPPNCYAEKCLRDSLFTRRDKLDASPDCHPVATKNCRTVGVQGEREMGTRNLLLICSECSQLQREWNRGRVRHHGVCSAQR